MSTLEPYVAIDGIAAHFAVSISTVRAWIRSGRIPKQTYIKAGNTYRFKLSAVESALNNQYDAKSPQLTLDLEPSEPMKLYPSDED